MPLRRCQATMARDNTTSHKIEYVTPLVFETFLKCGKIQCKSTFNKKNLYLLIIKDIETKKNKKKLYLPGDI